ncbi:MAG: hypothetical protein ABSA78_07355 [Candidatus Sulfotelmatobacter sp.]|jgi:hypothetical protein
MKRALPYVALVVSVGCGYLGYLAAVRIVYQYKQSTWFGSLGKQDADQLRETGQATFAFELSSMSIQNTPSSIQNNVNSLAKIRSKAPQELWPILDLRLAKDYAMEARLERQAGNQKAADEHLESAKTLLRSLGWRDVSDKVLTDLADAQLRSRLKQ